MTKYFCKKMHFLFIFAILGYQNTPFSASITPSYTTFTIGNMHKVFDPHILQIWQFCKLYFAK